MKPTAFEGERTAAKGSRGIWDRTVFHPYPTPPNWHSAMFGHFYSAHWLMVERCTQTLEAALVILYQEPLQSDFHSRKVSTNGSNRRETGNQNGRPELYSSVTFTGSRSQVCREVPQPSACQNWMATIHYAHVHKFVNKKQQKRMCTFFASQPVFPEKLTFSRR